LKHNGNSNSDQEQIFAGMMDNKTGEEERFRLKILNSCHVNDKSQKEFGKEELA